MDKVRIDQTGRDGHFSDRELRTDWAIAINGRSIESGKNFRQGVLRDADGVRKLVVWLKAASTEPMEITMSRLSM